MLNYKFMPSQSILSLNYSIIQAFHQFFIHKYYTSIISLFNSMDEQLMQQLLQGKYKLVEELPKKHNKYHTFIVSKINVNENQQNRERKYIAKIQNLTRLVKTTNGKIYTQKKPRSALVLQEEIDILLDIQRNIDKLGFPKAYDVYSLNQRRILITDLRSLRLPKLIPLLLQNLNSIQYTKFCLKMLYDLLDRIETIHRANYIHQNLRPEIINFKKAEAQKDILFVTDYSKVHKFNQYNIKEQNYHRPYQYGVKAEGKTGFASIWSHANIAKSRRDDIQSFCYICIYVLQGGKLPWADIQFQMNEKKERQVFEKKLKIIEEDIFQSQIVQQQSVIRTLISIMEGFSNKSQPVKQQKKIGKIPKQIKQILIECRNLGFEDQPNYHQIRKILKKAMNRFQITQTQDYYFPISESELYPKGY